MLQIVGSEPPVTIKLKNIPNELYCFITNKESSNTIQTDGTKTNKFNTQLVCNKGLSDRR